MIEIIKAVYTDIEKLIDVKVDAFDEEIELYGFGPPNYDSAEEMTRSISRCDYFKVICNDKIIGGFNIWDKGTNWKEIGSIYVSSYFKNQGIGSEVMKYIFLNYSIVER